VPSTVTQVDWTSRTQGACPKAQNQLPAYQFGIEQAYLRNLFFFLIGLLRHRSLVFQLIPVLDGLELAKRGADVAHDTLSIEAPKRYRFQVSEQ
jgi:hypothetical protein